MKATRTRTLRGSIDVVGNTGKTQILVDDGNINRGYKVTDFFIFSFNGKIPFNANLAFSPQVLASEYMDTGNNAQFAWTWLDGGADAPIQRIIDPDHVAVRDMFISIEDVTTDGRFNYMIVVEEYAISDEEAIINIIKEGSQSL
jgi:hypothetical protein